MCLAPCCQSHSCSRSQGRWLFPHSAFLDGTNAFAAQLVLQTYISQGERKESWAEELPKRRVLSEGEWSLHLRSKLVLLVRETWDRGGSFQNWWLLNCLKIFCPSPKCRFPWRTVCSPQKLQVVSRENFGTGWSLTFNFSLCFLFRLGLMSIFSSDAAALIHFSKQAVKNVEGKIPLLPLGFTLPSSEDRPILHTFATTVTSAPPPPEIKTLSQEKQSRTGECTSARKLCR